MRDIFLALLLASAPPPLGYGSADAVLPAKTQELFYLGFELGLSVATGEANVGKLVAVEHAWDGSPLGAQYSAEKLVKRGVVELSGYPTSQDALLAARVALKAGIMSIFAAARHSDLGKLGPTVVSTVPSMSFDVESMMAFIQQKYPGKRGVVITNPASVFCQNQEDLVVSKLKEPRFKDMHLRVVHVGKDLKIPDGDLATMKPADFDYLYVATYPDMSVRALGQLEAAAIDVPIFANASWTTDDFELIRRLLIRHQAPVYSVSLWVRGSKAAAEFEREVRKRYGREPSSEAAYGYDLGMIVGTTLKRIKGQVTAEAFKTAFYQQPCFQGSTSGEVCFDAKGGHAKRQLTFVKFSQGGFVP